MAARCNLSADMPVHVRSPIRTIRNQQVPAATTSRNQRNQPQHLRINRPNRRNEE